MNEEELDALLRSADARARRAAQEGTDIEIALMSAREKELDALLRQADAKAVQAAEKAIDVGRELVAAKGAAASQLVTDQAIGETPSAAVIRSLMHIVDVSETVTVTTSAPRRRSHTKILLAAGALLLCAVIGMSVLLLHLFPDAHFHAQSTVTAAGAFAGATFTTVAFGFAAMKHARSHSLRPDVERSAWRMARTCSVNLDYRLKARTGYTTRGSSAVSEPTIVAIALPESRAQRQDDDAWRERGGRDTLNSLEPTAEC